MNNNNYFHLNYNYYEKHLSPFGKKVLKVLIHNCRKERASYKINHPQNILVQKKKTLQFRDSSNHLNKPSANFEIHSRNECNLNTELNFTITDNPIETIKSAELLNTIEFNTDIGIENRSIEYLGHSVSIETDRTSAEVYGLYDSLSLGKKNNVNIPDSKDYEVVEQSSTVAWDDIFDNELLVCNKNEDEKSIVLKSHEDRPFLFDLSNSNGYKVYPNKLAVCNETKLGKQQNTKRKKQVRSSDTLPKKAKEMKENRSNILRKQKYTKAVKNWLNDVNLNNPIDEEATAQNQSNIPGPKVSKTAIKKATTANTSNNKKSKKIVQAQLANKDGIMKFSKPTIHNIEVEKVLEKCNTSNPDSKGKKVKTKFVAPIKSQVPVKEVTYEIYTANDGQFRQFDLELNSGGDQEYAAVLVYSNNFNQLNRHHTEDVGEVDGLMISIHNAFYYFQGVLDDFKKFPANILEHKLICYEGKDVINYLASKLNMKISPAHIVDVKIGSSLLNPDDPPENFSDVQKLLSFTPQFTIATDCPLQKTAWYITLLKECVLTMTDMLIQQSLWNVFVNIEMRLLPVIAAMEWRGVMVDLETLTSLENILITKMKSVEQSCYKAAGRCFQINSPLQIRALLYDELQLDTKCNVKIRETLCKGAKSTSETMLRSLVSEHPLPRLILEYRHLHKAHATFITGIAHHVKDGVVKPTWVQTAAVTGRIASNNPNLQAIPKSPFNLTMFPEDNDEDVPRLKFRSVYTSRPGYTLVAADFKHVECRVFAHVAADTSLLDALRCKQDLFKALAAKWLQKPEIDISSEDRERTKRIIYASLYGAGTRKLMDILNISYDQTLTIVASFNRTFPSLKSFGRSMVSRCEQNGGRLSTICGRARQFKNITNDDFGLRSQAERQAVNFIVQGSAADLCKMAMVETNEQLSKCNPPVEAHLLLQIHDELVWEVKDEHIHNVVLIIKDVMENCGHYCGMSMDLPVEVHIGKNWGEMVEYTT